MLMPKYYEFCTRVKIMSGHKALENIPQSLLNLKASRPMVVTDKGVAGAGLLKVVTQAIRSPKIKVAAVVDTIPQDSDLKVVNEIVKVYRKNKCDSIIAVGGGSVMDSAKAVNILASLGGDDLMDYEGYNSIKEKLNPLVAIPTTAGTGSEVTIAAIIANHEKKIKMTFGSNFLLPDIAVLDPRMTKTLPPAITAATAMDALTHACEAYFCISKNPISDGTALLGIQMISQNLLNVVKKPNDLDGRLNLAVGATLAGMAFSNSFVGLVHNLGHAAGGVCNVPHGVAMSIFLPYGMEYALHKTPQYLGELLYALAGDEVYAATPKKERARKTVAYIRQLNQDLHDATGGRHARFLNEIKDRNGNQLVPKEKIPEIAAKALGDGMSLFNPEEISYDDALMVITAAWDGSPLNLKKIKKGRKVKY